MCLVQLHSCFQRLRSNRGATCHNRRRAWRVRLSSWLLIIISTCWPSWRALAWDENTTRPAASSTNSSSATEGQQLNSQGAGAAATGRQSPVILKASDHQVGRRMPDFSWTDIDGHQGRLSQLDRSQLLVVAFTSTSCPISKKYFPTLARIIREQSDANVQFLLINPIANDSLAEIRQNLERQKLTVWYVHDRSGELQRKLPATSTADVLVIDAAQTLLYHGAIDDQYGLGYSLEKPRQNFLTAALQSIRTGKRPVIAATVAPGCALDKDPQPSAPAPVTYHNRISRIIQNNCGDCHRDGGTGPFSLLTHQDLLAHKAMVKQVVERSTMPPWFAAPTTTGHANPWSNDSSLSAADRADLLSWLQGDAPAGDPAEAPLPRRYPESWQIGQPDLVVRLPHPVNVKATGVMPYQFLRVELNLDEDRWVEAAEVKPTAPGVVHHVLVFVQASDGRLLGGRGEVSEEGRGFLAAYVPGNAYFEYEPGFAKRLPKGSKLIFQMHYTPNGEATSDQTELALRFAKEPPRHEVQVVGIANTRLKIPPGDGNYSNSANLKVPADAMVMAFFPHMHLRGKAFRYEVTYPDQRQELLLDVPRYDFNWQIAYRRWEPLRLPAGTNLKVTGWFDNSDSNPANPDSSRVVTWGPQTYDEMLLGYVEYYLPATTGEGKDELRGVAGWFDRLRDRGIQSSFKQADRDEDGRLSWDEARRAFSGQLRYKDRIDLLERHFKQLDADQDSYVTAEEFSRVKDLR
jgi:peroxiredoxin